MTVQELIEELTEIEELNVVYISKDGCGYLYENEDIDTIEEEQLKLHVIDYDVTVKTFKTCKCRIVDILC